SFLDIHPHSLGHTVVIPKKHLENLKDVDKENWLGILEGVRQTANRIEKISGEERIKKNVFKVDNRKGYKQKYLKDLDLSKMFIQELSDSDMDMRLFVKNGEVVGGWTRHQSQCFMTVSKGIYSMYNKPEDRYKNLARNVARILKADFIAIDIMDMRGEPLLQEISLHPGFNAYETKIEGEPINIAEAIITSFSN
ncbi:MAG TPA: HIT domain-containing protein, partial [Candidatus Dojkabacteria bacterium]|nr:HIT domain-containing protein [Candidatus Dojkabacteria bacterium]